MSVELQCNEMALSLALDGNLLLTVASPDTV
jgi:hypothetical protein